MEWERLDLSRGSFIDKEVDFVISKIDENLRNNNDAKLASLVQSIQDRIKELEAFYSQNNNGEWGASCESVGLVSECISHRPASVQRDSRTSLPSLVRRR